MMFFLYYIIRYMDLLDNDSSYFPEWEPTGWFLTE